MELNPRFRWFKITFKDFSYKSVSYVFRGLTAKELRTSGSKLDRFAAEDYILSCCLVSSTNIDAIPYLIANTILGQIYKVSGLTEEEETFKIAADWIQSDTGILEAAAVSMISGLTLELLDSCCPTDYAKYLLLGKYQFENMYGVSVQQAFGLAPPSETAGYSTREEVAEVDNLGREKVKRQSSVFQWQKGQAIEIDPAFINDPIVGTYVERPKEQ